MKTVKKLIDLLSPREIKQASIVVLLMFVMAIFDVVGVASIMPFMAVISNPEIIQSDERLRFLFNYLSFKDESSFILFLGAFLFGLLVASIALKALTTYIQLHFTLYREFTLGKRLITAYLKQPYRWFLNQNGAELGKTVLSEVDIVISGGLLAVMTLIAQSAVTIGLVALLMWVDFAIATTVALVMGALYLLVLKTFNLYLTRLGDERTEANASRFLAASEAFNAIKEIKVAGNEAIYLTRFLEPAEVYAKHKASAQVVAQLPRFVVEAIAFGGVILVTLYLMVRDGGFIAAIPTISLYAFTGYRLMPALQQLYASIVALRFSVSAIDKMHDKLFEIEAKYPSINDGGRINFERTLSFRDVEFFYPGGSPVSGLKIDFEIFKGQKVGFVGKSGSGKSTIIDLIMGLLEPEVGKVVVDGVSLSPGDMGSWRKLLGYVPQQIYLSDDTIAANIAFGVEPDKIDMNAVQEAARLARIDDFIHSELNDGYNTSVGERGLRISGGQRQRLGIARALYNKPEVLIFDEATSALDSITEKEVLNNIAAISRQLTVILVSHRVSATASCDQVFYISDGRLKASGNYKYLKETNEEFCALDT